MLHTPHKKLTIGKGLKKFMTVHGHATLEDLLRISAGDLLKQKGFNERTLKELLGFLKKNQLSHLLKS